METSNWLVVGALVGLGGGGGLFFLRRLAWPAAVALGWISLALAGLGIVVGIGVVASSMNRGGDAVIAGMTFLIFSVAGVGLAGFLTLVFGAIQAKGIGRPVARTMLTCLADPLLCGLAIWVFLSAVIAPLHKARSDASWQAELDRRKRMEALEKSIPEQYRNMPLGMIDQHRQMRRPLEGQLPPMPPLVPPETEQKMRELASLKGQTYTGFDMGAYQRIEQAKIKGIQGLGLGWLAGAIVVPLGFILNRTRQQASRE